MKKGEKHIVYAIGAIALIFIVAMQMGYLTQYGIKPLSQTPPSNNNNNNPPASDYANGIGKFAVQIYCAKTLDSSSLAVATDFDVWMLHYVNGVYAAEGSAYAAAGTGYFTASAADNGYMYIEVKPHSTTYYVDYNTIMSREGMPGYVTGVQYINDPLMDGHKDFIFQFNLKGQSIPNSGFPLVTFTVWGIGYNTNLGSVIGTAPANQTEIEMVSVPKYAEWDMNFTTAGTGMAVYKIEVKLGNSTITVTDQTKVNLKYLSFPGLGQIDVTQFDQVITTTDIRYTYTPATSLYGADYIWLPANSNDKFPVNAQFQCTLASVDQIPVLLTVYYFDTAGAGHSVSANALYSNGFWLCEATGGTP